MSASYKAPGPPQPMYHPTGWFLVRPKREVLLIVFPGQPVYYAPPTVPYPQQTPQYPQQTPQYSQQTPQYPQQTSQYPQVPYQHQVSHQYHHTQVVYVQQQPPPMQPMYVEQRRENDDTAFALGWSVALPSSFYPSFISLFRLVLISFNKYDTPPTDVANDPTVHDVTSLLRWPFDFIVASPVLLHRAVVHSGAFSSRRMDLSSPSRYLRPCLFSSINLTSIFHP